jgi:hypothetical protein
MIKIKSIILRESNPNFLAREITARLWRIIRDEKEHAEMTEEGRKIVLISHKKRDFANQPFRKGKLNRK